MIFYRSINYAKKLDFMDFYNPLFIGGYHVDI